MFDKPTTFIKAVNLFQTYCLYVSRNHWFYWLFDLSRSALFSEYFLKSAYSFLYLPCKIGKAKFSDKEFCWLIQVLKKSKKLETPMFQGKNDKEESLLYGCVGFHVTTISTMVIRLKFQSNILEFCAYKQKSPAVVNRCPLT